jgi:hypothetical protein
VTQDIKTIHFFYTTGIDMIVPNLRRILASVSTTGMLLFCTFLTTGAFNPSTDTEWINQWDMRNINIDHSWDLDNDGELTNPGKASITVAIIDEGVDFNHEDFHDAGINVDFLWENPGEFGGIDNVNDDGNTLTLNGPSGTSEQALIDDIHGIQYDEANSRWVGGGQPKGAGENHGTRTAGLIASIINNGRGIVGVAQVNIMSINIRYENPGQGQSPYDPIQWLDEALDYAIDEQADIIAIGTQWDYKGDTTVQSCAQQYIDPKLLEAKNKGIFILCPCGNSPLGSPRSDMMYPACNINTISVASMNNNYDWWDRSRFDTSDPIFVLPNKNKISFTGPGGQTGTNPNQIISTQRGTTYGFDFGTSWASPHIAGVAALIWSIRPDLSRENIIEILKASCHDIIAPPCSNRYDTRSGWGWVDAERAIAIARMYKDRDNFEMPIGYASANGFGVNALHAMDEDAYGDSHIIYTTNEYDGTHNPNSKYQLRYAIIDSQGKKILDPPVWITDNTWSGEVGTQEGDIDIYARGMFPVIVFRATVNGNNLGDLYYYRPFPTPVLVRITNDIKQEFSPKIISCAFDVYIFWYKSNSDIIWDPEIFYIGYGFDFSIIYPLAILFQNPNPNTQQIDPDMDVYYDTDLQSNIINIMWRDNRNGNFDILYARFNSFTKQFIDNQPLTVMNSVATIDYFKMCCGFNSGINHVLWRYQYDTTIGYKRTSKNNEEIVQYDTSFLTGTIGSFSVDYGVEFNQPTSSEREDTYFVYERLINGHRNINLQIISALSPIFSNLIAENDRIIETDGGWPIIAVKNCYDECPSQNIIHKNEIRIIYFIDSNRKDKFITTSPIWKSPSSFDGPEDSSEVDTPDIAMGMDGTLHMVYRSVVDGIDEIIYQQWSRTTVEHGGADPFIPTEANADYTEIVDCVDDELEHGMGYPKIRTYYDESLGKEFAQIIYLVLYNDYMFKGRTWSISDNSWVQTQSVNLYEYIWIDNPDVNFDVAIDDDGDGYLTPKFSDLTAYDRDSDRIFLTWNDEWPNNGLYVATFNPDFSNKKVVNYETSNLLIGIPSIECDLAGNAHIVYSTDIYDGYVWTNQIKYRKIGYDTQTNNQVMISSSIISQENAQNQRIPAITIDRPVHPNWRQQENRDVTSYRNSIVNGDNRASQKIHIVWNKFTSNNGWDLRYCCCDINGNPLTTIKSLLYGASGINFYKVGQIDIVTDYQNEIHIVSDHYPGYDEAIYYLKTDTVGNIIRPVNEIDGTGGLPHIVINRLNENIIVWEDQLNDNQIELMTHRIRQY